MRRRPRVAILHGQRRIVTFLELELTEAGFSPRSAENANDGFELVRGWEPQVVVLDAKIPGLDALAFLRLLRLYTQVPIVTIGVGLEQSEKVAFLANGADHCVSLPGDLSEIIAVLHAMMRHPALRDPDVHVLADLEVDLRTRSAHRAGRALTLTRQEFDLLATLIGKPSRVYSRNELLAMVWGGEVEATVRAVDACVRGLRRKLDAPFETPILQTVRGVGFTLRCPP